MKDKGFDILSYVEYLRSQGVDFIPLPSVKNQRKFMRSVETGTEDLKKGQLEDLRRELGECRRCRLHETRTNVVFGEGNPDAAVVFVGEAPGEEEDRTGRPFVGRAGQLLTRMIEAMTLKRDKVYICNVLKCRPPDNRDPLPDEVSTCFPFLKRQLEIIRPRVVVTLGKHALKVLTGERAGVTTVHGRWYNNMGMRILPTFHPAFLLRYPSMKRAAWDDLKKVMKELGLK